MATRSSTRTYSSSLPVGVPRPPTARPSRRSSTRTLRATQPRSPASSQDLIRVDLETPHPKRKRKSTTPSPSPPPLKPPKRLRRSTTPTGEPPVSAAFLLPPPSQARAPVPPRARTPGPVPQFPPSCFRTAAPVQRLPTASARAAPLLPALPQKRPRPRAATSAAGPAGGADKLLLAQLTRTDFAAADPAALYALQSSLLFRTEYVARGAPTYEQGGKRGYGARLPLAAAKGVLKYPQQPAYEVPAWARTAAGDEWEEDVLRRLGARLAAVPVSASPSAAGEELVPLLFGADLERLRATRLGDGGGMECYLVGREWPVRTGIWTGWVVSSEWREREGAWVYAVDDGTAVLEVLCPSLPSFSSSCSLSPPSLAPAPHLPTLPSAAPLSPRRALAAAQFAHLEARAAAQSERVVVQPGECVRVVGRVEQRRNAWDAGRRVVAIRMDILTDVNAVPMHHRLAAALHAGIYAAPFDARGRLAAIERAEREAKQRAWDAASSAAGSEWGGTASVASSPERGVRYRPTRPAKLAREDLTLSNFLIYIRHHLLKRYVRTLAPGPVSPASSPLSADLHWEAAGAGQGEGEETLPFTLAALQANRHLALFATRLAQERARSGVVARTATATAPAPAPAPAPPRAWVAPPPGGAGAGAHRPARGRVDRGAARLLLPPPSSASGARARVRRAERPEEADGREDGHGHRDGDGDGPLRGAELDQAVGRVWREAIRTMRRNGMVVEAEADIDTDAEEVPLLVGRPSRRPRRLELDLPDLPRHRAAPPPLPQPQTPLKKKRAVAGTADAPWGAVVLPSASPAGETTPRARAHAPAFGCPWGDAKLFGDDDQDDRVDRDGAAAVPELKTPRAAQRAAPVPPPLSPPQAEPAAAWRSAVAGPASASASPARSDCSVVTTGSLAGDDGDAPLPVFQLVTPRSLAPLVLGLVRAAYATGQGSVTDRDVRVRLHVDARWSAVAQFSEAVGKALEVLAEQGKVERHGQGWRPVRRGWA